MNRLRGYCHEHNYGAGIVECNLRGLDVRYQIRSWLLQICRFQRYQYVSNITNIPLQKLYATTLGLEPKCCHVWYTGNWLLKKKMRGGIRRVAWGVSPRRSCICPNLELGFHVCIPLPHRRRLAPSRCPVSWSSENWEEYYSSKSPVASDKACRLKVGPLIRLNVLLSRICWKMRVHLGTSELWAWVIWECDSALVVGGVVALSVKIEVVGKIDVIIL